MKSRSTTRLTTPGLFVVLFVIASAAQPLQLLSTADPSEVASVGANGDSLSPVLSRDGRYVLFSSTANNLLTTTNNTYGPVTIPASLNVYLRDRSAQTNVLVSQNRSLGGGGNADSRPVCVSTNGRYVLFESQASDLVTNKATNGLTDVFVRDLINNVTLLVSASTDGGTGNGNSYGSAMTPDGRYVAFVSEADNLVAGDTNGIPDVFMRDLQTGTTVLVSAGTSSSDSGSIIRGSQSPAISADGRYIAFFSTASGLVPNVPGGGDVYVRDMLSGTNIWVSSGARLALSNALQIVAGSFNEKSWAMSFNHVLSDDGRFVAFESCTNLYPSSTFPALILRYNLLTGLTDVVHTNAAVRMAAFESIHDLNLSPDGRYIAFIANTLGLTNTCVQLWDGNSGSSLLVSGNTNGQVSPGTCCSWPAATADGRYVLFWSDATDLTTNALLGDDHLFVHDFLTATTSLVNADTNGVGSSISPTGTAGISDDGHFVVFDGEDGDLIADDNNKASDVFVRTVSASDVELVSARAQGPNSVTPNGVSLHTTASLSSDGRYLAFYSSADNLTAQDTNGCTDIFLQDRVTGNTVLVSANTNGWSGDAPSSEPALSLNGGYVAFTSGSDDLVPGDTNGLQDVFVRDLSNATTRLVSVSVDGYTPGDRDSYAPRIGADGRFVVFVSMASNLAPGPFVGGNGENVFVRDLRDNRTYALTTGGDYSAVPCLTPDGHRVLYAFGWAPFVPPTLGVWDCLAGTCIYSNTLAGVTTTPAIAISPDGQRIAYSYQVSGSGTNYLNVTDITTGTTWLVDSGVSNVFLNLRFSVHGERLACVQTVSSGGPKQIYLYNVDAGTRTLVSHTYASSTPANDSSDSADINPDGRFVAYRSLASDLVPGDTNQEPDIFLYDDQTGLNNLLSTSFSSMAADNRSLRPVLSRDGQTLVFGSWASNMAPLDLNRGCDIFAFVLLSVSIQAGTAPDQGPFLSWPWVPGYVYRVQYKDDMSDTLWHDLAGTITNIGAKAFLQDTVPPNGHRFYRVGY